MTCGKCDKPITENPQSCWYCPAYLCLPCWEAIGHCGHAEAEAITGIVLSG